MRFERLSNFATRNFGLRAIATVLAIGLWLFVNAGQHEAQTPLDVPVSYRRLAPGLVIVNQRPDFVRIQVSGPRTLLSLLDPGRLEIRLDLSHVATGQASFRISPEMFNVPRQTMVTSISPSQIVLDIDRVVMREVPVHLEVLGPITSGYAVGSIDLNPASIAVSGPSRDVSRLDRIDTEPFDVRGATEQIERSVRIVIPPGPIRMPYTQVEARVRFEEVMGDKEFHTVEVTVRDPDYKYRLYTHDVSVTVHGPIRKLSSLNLDGMVYVEARGTQPGVHELPVQIELPDGLQVVRQTPDRIKLRILASKAGTRS